MPPSPPTPTAPKTIADFFTRPAKRLRSAAPAPAASLSSSSASSLSPEQRRRADTNLALARARRNRCLAESKAKGTSRPRSPRVPFRALRQARLWCNLRFGFRGICRFRRRSEAGGASGGADVAGSAPRGAAQALRARALPLCH